MAMLSSPMHSKKLFDESFAVEWGKIGFLFAGANETSGDAEFLLNGHGHAAFAAPIEFGEDDSGESNGFVKFRCLHERVRAGGGIEHNPLFLRGIGIVLAQRACDLGELLHEVALCMEPACRIANEKLDISAVRAIPRIVAKGRRVPLVLAFQYLDT